jgi:hypothetical protein
MNEWIRVEDRLPDDLEEVMLVDATCEAYFIGIYSNKVVPPTWESCETGEDIEHGTFKITHWMPLPAPPKDKQ